jgi:hypothetical protein
MTTGVACSRPRGVLERHQAVGLEGGLAAALALPPRVELHGLHQGPIVTHAHVERETHEFFLRDVQPLRVKERQSQRSLG